MGLFSKKEPSEAEKLQEQQKLAEKELKRDEKEAEKAALKAAQLAKLEAKAREKAGKKGIDVEGALAVAHDMNKDNAFETLVVWPDRVEKHNHGKVASMFGSGKGAEAIPVGNIASVQASNSGVFGKLEIHGSGNSINYRTSQPQAHHLQAIVMELVSTYKHQAAPTQGSVPSVADQIKQLAELRDAGLVTEQEFEAKRTELLARM